VTEHGWGAFDIGITIVMRDHTVPPISLIHKCVAASSRIAGHGVGWEASRGSAARAAVPAAVRVVPGCPALSNPNCRARARA
jgi:hypothetical protein